MGFFEAVEAVFRQYARFSGRAGRDEFWWYVLFAVALTMILIIMDSIAGIVIFTYAGLLAIALPSFAVTARRLHDMNRSGWWCLIGLVPYAGAGVLLVWCAFEGTIGANAHGPDPRDPDAVASVQIS